MSKPARWQYIALDDYPNGTEVKGIVEADDMISAIEQLTEKGLFLIEVRLLHRKQAKRLLRSAVSRGLIRALRIKHLRNDLAAEGRLLPFEKK